MMIISCNRFSVLPIIILLYRRFIDLSNLYPLSKSNNQRNRQICPLDKVVVCLFGFFVHDEGRRYNQEKDRERR